MRSSKNRFVAAAGLVLVLGCCFSASLVASEQPPRKVFRVPPDLAEAALEQRTKDQNAALAASDTFYFFEFTDRIAESGIEFVHQIVDDAGKTYKMVHYDHGNGVAAADVDGDGLEDLYFTTQVGSNQLWRNRGGGRFEDITTPSVALGDRISVTASFADIDNDGDADLFVTTVKMGNVLLENKGDGRFEDISAAAGVDYVGHSSAAVFFDYDNDGLTDLFVTNVGTYTTSQQGRHGFYIGVQQAFSGHLFEERTESSILYRNLGDRRFEDVSAKTGLVDTSWSGDASPADLDGDGFLDLYVFNMQGDDHYYRNVDGQRFVDMSAAVFPTTPWGSMGGKFFDYDRDGRQDLVLVDMHSDMSEVIGPEREKFKARMQWGEEQLQGGDNNIFGNGFYRNLGVDNDGTPRFEEISDQIGVENYWPWGLSVGDLNADGYDDIFITASMNYPFRYGVNSLLLNDRGTTFIDSEMVVGVEPRAGDAVATEWFELECGGADAEHDHCQGIKGPVTIHGALGSRSSVIFDLDDDGDLDIVTNEFNSAPQVLVSDLAEQQDLHFLELRLIGTRSNRDGLGARAEIKAGDSVFTKVHDGQSGYLSQSALPLYFGLGSIDRIDSVTVHWPSGIEQVIATGLELNRTLEIEEPAETE